MVRHLPICINCFFRPFLTFACLVLIMTKTVQKEDWLKICLEGLYASLTKGFPWDLAVQLKLRLAFISAVCAHFGTWEQDATAHWQTSTNLLSKTFFNQKSQLRSGILFASTEVVTIPRCDPSNFGYYEHIAKSHGKIKCYCSAFASRRHAERWPHVCRVKITFGLILTIRFISTKTNSIKCLVNWNLLRIHERLKNFQPHLPSCFSRNPGRTCSLRQKIARRFHELVLVWNITSMASCATHSLMVAFITWSSNLIPLIEGLCVAQIHVDLSSWFFGFVPEGLCPLLYHLVMVRFLIL